MNGVYQNKNHIIKDHRNLLVNKHINKNNSLHFLGSINWRQRPPGSLNKFWKMPMQVEERDEEVSNEILEDSELGPLSINKLEVKTKEFLYIS